MNHGEQALRPETRHSNLMMFYKKSQVIYEPLGVVAGIVSWNYRAYPFSCIRTSFFSIYAFIALHNAWSPILAAIFSGNGVVLKCSEHVIWSTTWFVGAISACLKACGHNGDLVQVVCCYPEQADAVTQSPLVKHITFIGSETVGRKVRNGSTFLVMFFQRSFRSRKLPPHISLQLLLSLVEKTPLLFFPILISRNGQVFGCAAYSK